MFLKCRMLIGKNIPWPVNIWPMQIWPHDSFPFYHFAEKFFSPWFIDFVLHKWPKLDNFQRNWYGGLRGPPTFSPNWYGGGALGPSPNSSQISTNNCNVIHKTFVLAYWWHIGAISEVVCTCIHTYMHIQGASDLQHTYTEPRASDATPVHEVTRGPRTPPPFLKCPVSKKLWAKIFFTQKNFSEVWIFKIGFQKPLAKCSNWF